MVILRRAAIAIAIAGFDLAGCSLLVSYDGYGDGVRPSDAGSEASDSGGDASDSDGDASDGGDAEPKRYAMVVLGGQYYVVPRPPPPYHVEDIDSVEIAVINADGTLAPFALTTSLPSAQRELAAVGVGSSIFFNDTSEAGVTHALADGGLASWTSISGIGRDRGRLACAGMHLYVASGRKPGVGVALETFYAKLLGPTDLGPWTMTSPLPEGSGRVESELVTNGNDLYLVGGDSDGDAGDVQSVLHARADETTGALGPWAETSGLPFPGDHPRAVVAQGHIIVLGADYDLVEDKRVYTSAIQEDGTLAAWEDVGLHSDQRQPGFTAHRDVAYLVGGYTEDQAGAASSTDVYFTPIVRGAPVADTWQKTSALNVARHRPRVVVVELP